MVFDLPLLFGLVVAFGVALYVVLDGFDLGIGILFPFAPDHHDRDVMMNSIAPFWDGNETWLVMGGSILFAAFPTAYSTLLPAFYIPLMVMLFALLFRGVAFEFRFKATRLRWLWDWSFSLGSLTATFSQGVVLGGFINGIKVEDGQFSGGPLDFLTPFAIVCGFGLVAGYALIGATWMVFKTEDLQRDLACKAGKRALIAVLAFIGIISLWTPFQQPPIAERWFSMPNILFLSPVPLLTAATALQLWRSLGRDHDFHPFMWTIVLFLLSFAGLAVSLYPYIVPRQLTVWDAAAEPSTLRFVGVGVALVLPVIIGYFSYAYWVFRGKATGGGGYH